MGRNKHGFGREFKPLDVAYSFDVVEGKALQQVRSGSESDDSAYTPDRTQEGNHLVLEVMTEGWADDGSLPQPIKMSYAEWYVTDSDGIHAIGDLWTVGLDYEQSESNGVFRLVVKKNINPSSPVTVSVMSCVVDTREASAANPSGQRNMVDVPKKIPLSTVRLSDDVSYMIDVQRDHFRYDMFSDRLLLWQWLYDNADARIDDVRDYLRHPNAAAGEKFSPAPGTLRHHLQDHKSDFYDDRSFRQRIGVTMKAGAIPLDPSEWKIVVTHVASGEVIYDERLGGHLRYIARGGDRISLTILRSVDDDSEQKMKFLNWDMRFLKDAQTYDVRGWYMRKDRGIQMSFDRRPLEAYTLEVPKFNQYSPRQKNQVFKLVAKYRGLPVVFAERLIWCYMYAYRKNFSDNGALVSRYYGANYGGTLSAESQILSDSKPQFSGLEGSFNLDVLDLSQTRMGSMWDAEWDEGLREPCRFLYSNGKALTGSSSQALMS